ncbi:MAG: hypothetical protein K8T20_12270 [Planctomycetes bacterium]|nr:hypothetical protein [Planctomycetota bacterium]
MRFVTTALFTALATASVFAQGAAPGKVDQKDIDAAIDKGAKWLGGAGGMGAGDHFELVMYTLFHSGTFPRDDKRFLEGVKTLQTKKLEKVYNAALTAMFLEAYDRVANQARIAECAQFLVDNQCENGQWSYGEPMTDPNAPVKPPDAPNVDSGGGSGGSNAGGGGGGRGGGSTALKKVPIKRNRRGPQKGDHSNTQYAILGLRSCAVAEVIIPKETWKEALKILEEAQDLKGSWSYGYYLDNGGVDPKKGGPKVTVNKNPGYGSMTCGCTGSLIIVKYYLKAQWGENQDFRNDKSVKDGLEWIAKNFTVEENANYEKVKATASVPSGDKYTWHYYYLYAMERAGMLGEFPVFGQYDWYQVGAKWLLANQDGSGMWKGKGGGAAGGNDPVADTCFAILFLRRATKPVVPKTTSGR